MGNLWQAARRGRICLAHVRDNVGVRCTSRVTQREVLTVAAAVLPICLLLLTGCGFIVDPPNNGGGGTTTTNRAYLLNSTSSSVSGFALGTGTLRALNGSPFGLGFVPQAAVVSRNNSYLYVAGPGTISGYAINSDGSLTALSCSGCATIATVAALDVSPDGQWLVGLDTINTTIDLWQIDGPTGALTAATPAGFSITDATVVRKRIHVSPSGGLVVASLGTAGEVLLSFNTTTGAFGSNYTRITTGSTQTSDNDAEFDSTSSRLYIARSGTNSGLAVYSISGLGLTAISGSPFATGPTPAAVALDSKSANVYVANSGAATITGYAIDATTGALTALTGSPYPSGTGVNFLALDSTGANLLASAQGGSPDLTVYTFDALTPGKLNASGTSGGSTAASGAVGVALTY